MCQVVSRCDEKAKLNSDTTVSPSPPLEAILPPVVGLLAETLLPLGHWFKLDDGGLAPAAPRLRGAMPKFT
ncbi:hypothetical protein A9Q94_01975 [Rhodobacterales bacterium 56_14_T64]|nr:hypothetical protein A9Q94_01975 [Rhodobacterales bacterium 56_14_T64]